MPTYTSTNSSIIGENYIAGLVSGFEDYIVFPVSNYETVVLQGDFSSDTSQTSSIEFSGERWVLTRPTSSGSYSVSYTPQTTCTVSITNSYYCRGSLSDMSLLDSRRDDVTANFAIVATCWGVLLCVVLSSLLRACSRSHY